MGVQIAYSGLRDSCYPDWFLKEIVDPSQKQLKPENKKHVSRFPFLGQQDPVVRFSHAASAASPFLRELGARLSGGSGPVEAGLWLSRAAETAPGRAAGCCGQAIGSPG